MNSKLCPICKYDNSIDIKKLTNDSLLYKCARCGDFIITESAAVSSEFQGEPNYSLSALIRERHVNGEAPLTINTSNLEAIKSQVKKYTPIERQHILLRYIEKQTKYPSSSVLLNFYTDFVICWAQAPEECRYWVDSLAKRELIKWGGNSVTGVYVSITPKGWEYLESFSREVSSRKKAFVAMSFSDEMDSVWTNALKPAIELAGYMPYRIDKVPHSERIDVKIMSEIKNSRFLVAEFTGHKHGVYFEAGYALGLGIPVIWCIKKSDLNKAHFDTRQYNHVVWENEDQLKADLESYINVIIG